MSEFLEQAIRDVAIALSLQDNRVENQLENLMFIPQIPYVIAQRERVLELEQALREIRDRSHRQVIELADVPCAPRIEFWADQIEQLASEALVREKKEESHGKA